MPRLFVCFLLLLHYFCTVFQMKIHQGESKHVLIDNNNKNQLNVRKWQNRRVVEQQSSMKQNTRNALNKGEGRIHRMTRSFLPFFLFFPPSLLSSPPPYVYRWCEALQTLTPDISRIIGKQLTHHDENPCELSMLVIYIKKKKRVGTYRFSVIVALFSFSLLVFFFFLSFLLLTEGYLR